MIPAIFIHPAKEIDIDEKNHLTESSGSGSDQ